MVNSLSLDLIYRQHIIYNKSAVRARLGESCFLHKHHVAMKIAVLVLIFLSLLFLRHSSMVLESSQCSPRVIFSALRALLLASPWSKVMWAMHVYKAKCSGKPVTTMLMIQPGWLAGPCALFLLFTHKYRARCVVLAVSLKFHECRDGSFTRKTQMRALW